MAVAFCRHRVPSGPSSTRTEPGDRTQSYLARCDPCSGTRPPATIGQGFRAPTEPAPESTRASRFRARASTAVVVHPGLHILDLADLAMNGQEDVTPVVAPQGLHRACRFLKRSDQRKCHCNQILNALGLTSYFSR